MDLFEKFSQFLNSGQWLNFIFWLKIISFIISLFLFTILIILLFKMRARIRSSLDIVSESIGAPVLPKMKTTKKWEKLLKQVETGDENAYKLAVIEADKTFDDMLKKIGYQGKDMGERMKQIKPGQMANIDELWQAHRTRNNIVHDPDFKITRSQAEKAVKTYEKILKELQVL